MNPRRQLLFFGAGASYGSTQDKFSVPPLGADLFNQLVEFDGRTWKQLPDEIADIYRKDFEAGMLALSNKMPHALTVFQRSMAAFFFRFGPTPSNLYVKLGKAIRSAAWRGSIASLNYERMMQIALSSQECNLFVGDGPPEGVEVCLPHGCCNLFCESVSGVAGAVSMAGMNVTTNGPVVSVDHPDMFWKRIRNDAFPPVMSYFEPSKFTTSGADFIAMQRNRLASLIQDAEAIAVVGVQVREQDSHIWDALSQSDARIYYCSGKSAAQSYEAWTAKSRASKASQDIVSPRYWSEDFDAISRHVGIDA